MDKIGLNPHAVVGAELTDSFRVINRLFNAAMKKLANARERAEDAKDDERLEKCSAQIALLEEGYDTLAKLHTDDDDDDPVLYHDRSAMSKLVQAICGVVYQPARNRDGAGAIRRHSAVEYVVESVKSTKPDLCRELGGGRATPRPRVCPTAYAAPAPSAPTPALRYVRPRCPPPLGRAARRLRSRAASPPAGVARRCVHAGDSALFPIKC